MVITRKWFKLAFAGYMFGLLLWSLLSTYLMCKLQVERWPLCCDFVKFYTAGKLAANAQVNKLHIYNPQTQFDYMNHLIAPGKTDSVFLHLPPSTFVFMEPFTLLPMVASFVLWTLLGAILFLASLWCAVDTVHSKSTDIQSKKLWIPFAFLATGALASEPAMHNFWFGQFAWFYLAIMLAAYSSLARQRYFMAGMWIILLAALKPQYGIFFAIALLFPRCKNAVITFLAGGVFIVFFTMLQVGLDNIIAYPQSLHYGEAMGGEISGLGAPYILGMRGLFTRLLPQSLALTLSGGLAAISLPLVWLIWRKAYRSPNPLPAIAWAMSLTCLSAIAVGLHTREYDLLFLLLPAALTLSSIQQISEALHSWSFRAWSLLLCFFPIISWLAFFILYPLKLYSPAMSIYIIVLLLCGLIEFFSERKQ